MPDDLVKALITIGLYKMVDSDQEKPGFNRRN